MFVQFLVVSLFESLRFVHFLVFQVFESVMVVQFLVVWCLSHLGLCSF